MYSTNAADGHWRIKVPAGAYAVEGRGDKVNGGRWTVPTHIEVRVGQTTQGVLVTDAMRQPSESERYAVSRWHASQAVRLRECGVGDSSHSTALHGWGCLPMVAVKRGIQ